MTTTHLNRRPAPQPRVHPGGHVTGRASLVFIGEQNGIDAYGNRPGGARAAFAAFQQL